MDSNNKYSVSILNDYNLVMDSLLQSFTVKRYIENLDRNPDPNFQFDLISANFREVQQGHVHLTMQNQ